jgi:murein DD-endopeptidase MepM/ murein hydrolase activator NlpD
MDINGTNYGSSYNLDNTSWTVLRLEDADSGVVYRYVNGVREEKEVRFRGIDANETYKDYNRVKPNESIYSHKYISSQYQYGNTASKALKQILLKESILAEGYSVSADGYLKKDEQYIYDSDNNRIKDDNVRGRQIFLEQDVKKDVFGRQLSIVATTQGKDHGISIQEQLVAAGVAEVSSFQSDPFVNNLIKLQSKAISEGRSLLHQPYYMNPKQFRDLMDQEIFFDLNPLYGILRKGKYEKPTEGNVNRYIRKGIEGIGAVYLPTSLSDDFQGKYAAPNIYRNFFAIAGLNRNEQLVASGYQRRLVDTADSQLSFRPVVSALKRVGLDDAFLDIYEPGEGIIGSTIRGIGRALDTITGFYALREERLRRQGDFDGGFKKFHRNLQNEREKQGIFERLLTGITASTTATATSLSFYFGLTHTITTARAHLEDIGVDYISSVLNTSDRLLKSALLPNEVINLFEGLDLPSGSNIGRELHNYSTFLVAEAASDTNSMSGITEVDIDDFYKSRGIDAATRSDLESRYGSLDPSKIDKKASISTRIKTEISEKIVATPSPALGASFGTSRVGDLKRIQSDIFSIDYDTGELDISRAGRTSGFAYRGWIANVGNLRKIDESNYKNIVRPILEQIAIVTTEESARFTIALDNLGEIVSKAPVIKFKEVATTSTGGTAAFLENVKISNYGYDRLEKIASALDEVASFIPASPLLYFKPFREASGISSLRVELGNGIKEDYSLRQLIGPGFSGLTKFTRNITRGLTSQTDGTSIVKQFVNNAELFQVEKELRNLENKFKDTTTKLIKLPRNRVLTAAQESFVDAKMGLNNLADPMSIKNFTDSVVGDRGLVNNLLRDKNIKDITQRYVAKYNDYETLLQKTPNYSLVTQQDVPSLYKNIRGLLFSVGPLLILDRVLDPYVMRAQGVDLITQVFLDRDVLHQHGEQFGQIDYQGVMPNYVRYPVMAAGYLAGGVFLPSFSGGRRGAGAVIAKTIDQALGTTVPVEDIIRNSGSQGESLLKRALANATDDVGKGVFNQLPITRVKTSFGYFGAILGAVSAILVAQTVFNLAAGTLNFLNANRRKDGSRPDDTSLAQGLRLGSALSAALNANKDKEGVIQLNRYQTAVSQTVQHIAQSAIHARKKDPRQVYTFAHQIPNPIFQLTTVAKIDQQGNTVSFGAGFQFLPILGSGSIPSSAVEVNLRPVDTIRSLLIKQLRERKESELNLSQEQEDLLKRESMGFAVSLLSFPGHLFSISRDTTFSQAISFIGAASYLAAGTEAVEEFLKANATESLRKELRQVKPFYQMVKGFSSSFETLLRYTQVPSLALGNAVMQSTTSFFGVNPETLVKIGPRARAAAPYVLAYVFASAATGPGGFFNDSERDTSADSVTAQFSRFGLVVAPITAIYGYGLQEAGVFKAAREFVDPQKLGAGYMAKKRALLGEIAQQSPDLIPPLVRTSGIRLSMASRRVFTISVVLAAIGLTARGLIGESLPFLDLVADAGAPQRTKEERAYAQILRTNQRRYRPEDLGGSALAITDYLFRSLTSVFGFDGLFYQDNPNPFLSLAGSIGLTQTNKGQVRVYQQAQSSFADISGSSYEVVNLVLTEALAQSFLHSLGKDDKYIDYDKLSGSEAVGLLISRYYEFRAPVNRKTPASAKNWISSDESKLVQGVGLVAAIAHKMSVIENLKNQSARELAAQMTLESKLIGGNVSNIKELGRIWTPLSSLGAMSAYLQQTGSATNILDTINRLAQSSLRAHNLGLSIGDGFLDRVQAGKIDSTERQSIITYYSQLGVTLFSDSQTFAARLAIAPMLLSVGMFSLGSTLVFATHILAAAAAYNQGATVTSLERIIGEKLNYFTSRINTKFGYEAVGSDQFFTVQPLRKGSIKPLQLNSSKHFFQGSSFALGRGAADLPPQGLQIATQISNKFKGHYIEIQSFLGLKARSTTTAAGVKLSSAQILYNLLEDVVRPLGTEVMPVQLVEQLRVYTKGFLDSGIPISTTGPRPKLYQVLGLTDDTKNFIVNIFGDQLAVNVQQILDEKNLTLEAKLRKIQGIIASKFQDIDNRIFGSGTASYQPDESVRRGVVGTVGVKKKIVKVEGKYTLTTRQIIQNTGYLGLAKEGVVGLTKVLGKLSDITLFLELSSFLSKAAVETNSLERERALIAAGITTGKLIPYFLSLGAIKFVFGNFLVAATFASVAAITVALDNALNEGRLVRGGVSKATNFFRWVEQTTKPLTNFGSRATYNFFRTLVSTPGTREALAILGVPFRLLDPVIENIWRRTEGIMGAYMLLNFFVPSSVDNIYNLYMSDRPLTIRGEPRMYMHTKREQEQDLANRLAGARLRALSLDSTPDIHPNLLGRPSGAREELTKSIYFDSPGGTSRVLADFDLTPSVSGSLLIALRANQAIINHYVYASLTRRHQLLPEGLGMLYIFTAGYLKSSLGAHGNYRGLLENTIETIKSAAASINNFFGTHKLYLFTLNKKGKISSKTFLLSRTPLILSSTYTGYQAGKLLARTFALEEYEEGFGVVGGLAAGTLSHLISKAYTGKPLLTLLKATKPRRLINLDTPVLTVPLGRRLVQGLVGTTILSAITYAIAESLGLDDKTKTQLLQTSIGVGVVTTNVLTIHDAPRQSIKSTALAFVEGAKNLISQVPKIPPRLSATLISGFLGYAFGKEIGENVFGEQYKDIFGVGGAFLTGTISAVVSDPIFLTLKPVQKVTTFVNKGLQALKASVDNFALPRFMASFAPALILATASTVLTEVLKNTFSSFFKVEGKLSDLNDSITNPFTVFLSVFAGTALFGSSSQKNLERVSQFTAILGRRFGSFGLGFTLYSSAPYFALSKAVDFLPISEERKEDFREGVRLASLVTGGIGAYRYGFSDSMHFLQYFKDARTASKATRLAKVAIALRGEAARAATEARLAKVAAAQVLAKDAVEAIAQARVAKAAVERAASKESAAHAATSAAADAATRVADPTKTPAYVGRLSRVVKEDISLVKNLFISRSSQGLILNVLTGVLIGSLASDFSGFDKEESMKLGGIVGSIFEILFRNIIGRGGRKAGLRPEFIEAKRIVDLIDDITRGIEAKRIVDLIDDIKRGTEYKSGAYSTAILNYLGGDASKFTKFYTEYQKAHTLLLKTPLKKQILYKPRSILPDVAVLSLAAIPTVTSLIGGTLGGEAGAVIGLAGGLAIDALLVARYMTALKTGGLKGVSALRQDLTTLKTFSQERIIKPIANLAKRSSPYIGPIAAGTGLGALQGAVIVGGLGYVVGLGLQALGVPEDSSLVKNTTALGVPVGALGGMAINLWRYFTFSPSSIEAVKATERLKFLSELKEKFKSLPVYPSFLESFLESVEIEQTKAEEVLVKEGKRINLLKRDLSRLGKVFSWGGKNFVPILDSLFLGFGLSAVFTLPKEESVENHRISYSNFFSTIFSSAVYTGVGLFGRSPTAALTIINKTSSWVDTFGRKVGEWRRTLDPAQRTSIDTAAIGASAAAIAASFYGVKKVGARAAAQATAGAAISGGATLFTRGIAVGASLLEGGMGVHRIFSEDQRKYLSTGEGARKIAETQVKDAFAALTIATTPKPLAQVGVTIVKAFTEEALSGWTASYYDKRLGEAGINQQEQIEEIVGSSREGAKRGFVGGLVVGTTGIVVLKGVGALFAGAAVTLSAPAVLTAAATVGTAAFVGSIIGGIFGTERKIKEIENEQKGSNLPNPSQRVGTRSTQVLVASLATDTPIKVFKPVKRESVEVVDARRLAQRNELQLKTKEQKKKFWDKELPTVHKLTADENYLLDDNLFVRGLKFGSKLLLAGGLVIISILGKVFSAIGDYFRGSRRDLRPETEEERVSSSSPGKGSVAGNETESSSDPFYSGFVRSVSKAFKNIENFLIPGASAATLPGQLPSGQRRRSGGNSTDTASTTSFTSYMLDSSDRPNFSFSADSSVTLQAYRKEAEKAGINPNLITSGPGQRWGRTHSGVDIVSPTNLKSIFEFSKVVSAKAEGGYGNRVKIAELAKNPDGSFVLTGRAVSYAHLASIQVTAGEVIQGGRQLGVMGSTGFSTGPHHHVEQHLLNSDGKWVTVMPQHSIVHATIEQKVLVKQIKRDEGGSQGLLPQLTSQYASLNTLASELSKYRQFDVNDLTGRAALGMALVIAELEVGAGKLNPSNYFTYMGGTRNKMRGFAQFNTEAGWDEPTRTQDGYVDLLGRMLRGQMRTPSNKSVFNITGLVEAIQSGSIKDGKSLELWITSQSRLNKKDWEPLFDPRKLGSARFRPIFDQIVEYWQRTLNIQPSSSSQNTPVEKAKDTKVAPAAQLPAKEYEAVTPSKKILSEQEANSIAKDSADIDIKELKRISQELQEVKILAFKEAERIALEIEKRKVVAVEVLEPAVVRKETLTDIPTPVDQKLAKNYTGEMTITKERLDLVVMDEANDSYWVDQRATPFAVIKDEELNRQDVFNLSNLHSNFRSSPFGTAEGWESQQNS